MQSSFREILDLVGKGIGRRSSRAQKILQKKTGPDRNRAQKHG
ncbi:Uncharacterised protein [Chlamydia trachomatis]|nr:hypothetical protein G9768_03600 [Chlamydia trachomatis G/9768]ADH19321.1 hypothetical protein G11222_03615 [Chlamydia trachomatis G/11222]ADH20244.1 hypothetical protein G11074_03595 [Chlamydia trachomatis G/11074]ADH97342.1 hypothetical protein CTG9301_03610 [Chlamydia trachomatis G/9301]CCP58259.1 hypothetical protein SOTONG1_00725 [Chlamydia trachomatis G/SotonG1]CRH44534.1 Uncharacterised protein [Chlamydia trachomatis]